MKVTIDTKQMIRPYRPILAEELARIGCKIKGGELTVKVEDFTVFLRAYMGFLEKVSKNAVCIESKLVRLSLFLCPYVIVESELTHRRIVVTIWYSEEENGMHYKYERDE